MTSGGGTGAPAPAEDPVTTEEKVRHLRDRAWPDDPPQVVETHMSWVFLTSDRAYKLKKPVHQPPVDYRTLESRRADCEAEVRLNQALAPGVYLGTVPLLRHGRNLSVGGDGRGEVVDWLVVMRRLPRAAMLDDRLARGDVDRDDVDALVHRMVEFYRSTDPAPTDPDAYRAQLTRQIETDRSRLTDAAFDLDRPTIDEVCRAPLEHVASDPEVGQRARRVVEGHGDLRPEHVVLGVDGPLVIDRLSFDPELRRVDPVFDLALLAVECELQGAAALGDRIVGGYQAEAGDRVSPATDALYRVVRALTRARLSIGHLLDGIDDQERKWRERTAAYLEIAARHAARLGPA